MGREVSRQIAVLTSVITLLFSTGQGLFFSGSFLGYGPLTGPPEVDCIVARRTRQVCPAVSWAVVRPGTPPPPTMEEAQNGLSRR